MGLKEGPWRASDPAKLLLPYDTNEVSLETHDL